MNHAVALLVTAALALPLWAHEGEDHAGQAAPAHAVEAGPRTGAETAAFELVAVLADKGLTLYLDRFATNEPVADAQVEVESGPFRAVATQAAPGLYAVSAGHFSTPGKYPLVISVQAGDVADLLTATLEVAQPAVVSEHAQLWDTRALGGAAGALLLAGAGLAAVRRRKRIASTAG